VKNYQGPVFMDRVCSMVKPITNTTTADPPIFANLPASLLSRVF